MQINTALFGPQEIQDDEIITFPEGLPGLENNTRFKVFHEQGKPTVHWLQSVDDEGICLSVVEAQNIDLAYEVTMLDRDSQLIDYQAGDELIAFVILFKQNSTNLEKESSQTEIRANIMGPIIINTRTQKGYQASLSLVKMLTVIKDM